MWARWAAGDGRPTPKGGAAQPRWKLNAEVKELTRDAHRMPLHEHPEKQSQPQAGHLYQ
ncbi:hypothetical protein Stube_03820 [Streptomyces tubercidicus]|uniref:Uncharacterized protein n=1 Tax=Streptomyces tubercidicus TaxID=47759 RepID=A0A640UJ79_9ACTN|nr:hypothetical protein Stube_03820 [Streptomyces tubercidicus]